MCDVLRIHHRQLRMQYLGLSAAFQTRGWYEVIAAAQCVKLVRFKLTSEKKIGPDYLIDLIRKKRNVACPS